MKPTLRLAGDLADPQAAIVRLADTLQAYWDIALAWPAACSSHQARSASTYRCFSMPDMLAAER
jgi:hypothetical protein